MRRLALCLCLFPIPALADTIEAPSQVAAVTLYPWGASVERQVTLDLPAGRQEVLIPDLPADTFAETLRVSAPAGVTIGAVNLLTGRLPPVDDTPSPAVQAAEDEVERLEIALQARDAAIAAIRLKATAAQEQIGVLRGLGRAESATAEEARALSRMVGEEALAALQAAHAAEQEALAAERARKDDVTALEKAQAALAALTTGATDHAALALVVDSAGGPAVIGVTTFTENAGWMPAYDLRLATDPAALTLDRAVLVRQASGEDWSDVNLTLSTARPADQSRPGSLYPDLRQIGDEEKAERMASDAVGLVAMEAAPAPVVADAMAVEMMGATVTYTYPAPVTLRDGVEDLRLALDRLDLTPEVYAMAVPRRDDTAFVMAEFTNTSAEPFLPGMAMLYLDGALVGGEQLDLLAAGDTTEVGFGPIDGMRVTRIVPERVEGDRGVITKSTELTEVAVLAVENLTPRDWPLRVLDQVPYSEQEDLEITYSADPPETDRDMDGQRGFLEWRMDLKAGEKAEIRLEQTLRWPEGQVLR